MKLIKVASGVLNQTALDWDGNQAHIEEAIKEAKKKEASVLCLPEMCIPGYGCDDAFLSQNTHALCLDVLEDLVPQTKGMIVSVGLPLSYRNGLFNTAALLVDGTLAGFVAKRFLAGDGLHYEPRWFKAWPHGVCTQVEIRGQHYPLGDYHFRCGDIEIGFEICEDAWVAKRPGVHLAQKAVDIILNPSASHFAFDKFSLRQRFVMEGSRAFGVCYIYSNLLGNASGRTVYDGGALIAAGGELVAVGERFSFKPVGVTCATIDIDLMRSEQTRLNSFTPDFQSAQDEIMCDFSFPMCQWEAPLIVSAAWEKSERLKEEEFTRSITLALFDYMRKSRSCGFVLSLSGGADSSAVACLCALSFHYALQDLGDRGLAKVLSYIPDLPEKMDVPSLTQRLVSLVYQRTRHSTQTTQHAAQALAHELKARFMDVDVDPMVQAYTSMLEKELGRSLSWENDDIALQNIQARCRSPGVWLLANINNALLLSTSNRSEAAVGYATMDGDTSGGVSPIAGIDKAFLRCWLNWLEKEGPSDAYPISSLDLVNSQTPTAELRPHASKQNDEDDLMPYPVLDSIEKAAIRDRRSPADVVEVVAHQFSSYSPKQIREWVRRFFQLWCRNQWKRERYAPSFHVDDENLDPKSWCRFPILSGGFSRELRQLDHDDPDTQS
jgi:NAD+ synthase (glutamine-hydrolysing)